MELTKTFRLIKLISMASDYHKDITQAIIVWVKLMGQYQYAILM